MTPTELFDLCVDAVERHQRGEADAAFVRLVLQRPNAPTGQSVKLFGRFGPSGRLDIVREKGGGFECVTCFDAVAILRFMRRHIR